MTLSSRSLIWDHCEFLRRLGLFFYPYLGFFVCTSHGCLVHPFHLGGHLKKHELHQAVGIPYLSKSGWTALMGHIQKSFKVVVNPESPQKSILPSHWSIIDAPVPGLPIILGFKCSDCGWLFGSGDSLRVHSSVEHKKSQNIKIPSISSNIPSNHLYSRVYVQRLFTSGTFTIQLFPAGCTRQYIQVKHLPTTILPLQLSTLETQFSSHSIPSLQISTLPPHISALGWVEWLQSTNLSPDFLRWLVNLPKCKESDTKDKDLEKVEYGLWKTSELLKGYLAVAEEKLESLAPGVRDAVRGQ